MTFNSKNILSPSSRRLLLSSLSLCLPVLTGGCSVFSHKPPPAPPAAQVSGGDVYQASGSNPDWVLTLANNTLTFNRKGYSTLIKTVRQDESDSSHRMYEGKRLRVDITPQTCTNSTTGQSYADTVKVKTSSGTYSGCGGDHVASVSVNNTKWVVTALDGKTIAAGYKAPDRNDATTDTSPVSQNTPTLNINANGDVSGSDGCNTYSNGMTFKPQGQILHTSASINSLMACPAKVMKTADKFNALRQAAISWQVNGTTLTLQTSDNRTVELRQIF